MPLTKRITLCLLSSHRWHATVQVDSCKEKITYDNTLFGLETVAERCAGCQKEGLLNTQHNGTYCMIKDWTQKSRGGLGKIVRFVDLF